MGIFLNFLPMSFKLLKLKTADNSGLVFLDFCNFIDRVSEKIEKKPKIFENQDHHY